MRDQFPAWPVGVAFALLVALGYLFELPVLRQMEGRATDWLFRSGRTDPPRASSRVVHADIDDNSLETVGRWPWPRSVLAEAVEALDELGARAIALDLLLIDPQDPQYLADGTFIDHDARLAQALRDAKAKTILATQVDEAGTRLSALWTTPVGRRKWDRIRELLNEDITLEQATVIAHADLDGERAARVRGRLLAIKQVVAREAAESLRREGKPCTVEELRNRLLPPDKNRTIERFPSLRILENAVRLQAAIGAVEARLPDTVDGVPYRRVEQVLAPLPPFAEAVDAIGVVNSRQDQDGLLRRITMRWAGHDKVYPQFGLAAVAAYRDVPMDALAAPEIRVGEFHLDKEEMLLSWPRIDANQPIVGLHQHLSLGRILAWSRSRREVESQWAELEEITRDLVRQYLKDQFTTEDLKDPKLRKEIEAELKSEAEFRLGEAGSEIGDEEKAWRTWQLLHAGIDRARRDVDLAHVELRQAIQNRLVFVGWYATGNFGDFFPTAVHERTPGVVAHSVVANSVITGYTVTQAPLTTGALITLLLGVASALLTSRTGPRMAFLFVCLLAVIYFAIDTLFVFGKWHIVTATSTPIAAILAAWAAVVVMRAVRERREKAQLRKQFGARISKQLFDHLLENPDTVDLAGQEKEVTSFFSDLAGFTAISEKLDSHQTVALLNRYMWAMNDELTKLSAYVNKFLGDGIMAVWGAFAVESPHAERACRAALACIRRLDKLTHHPDFEGLPRLSMRIGIATGIVTVGDCGAPPDLRDYTVIGDSANLAARLESANKQFGTRILINGRTHELIPDDLLTRPLGKIAVVGQQTATDVYELVAVRGEETPQQRDLVARTTRAVELFAAGDFGAAREAWVEIGEQHGVTPLVELYLSTIDELVATAAEDFDGVVRLTSK